MKKNAGKKLNIYAQSVLKRYPQLKYIIENWPTCFEIKYMKGGPVKIRDYGETISRIMTNP